MKALTRFSAALASSLPMASANCVSGRVDSLDAAPPTPACNFAPTNRAPTSVATSSNGDSRLLTMSSRRRLAVRGSISTLTKAKPASSALVAELVEHRAGTTRRRAAGHRRTGLLAVLQGVQHQSGLAVGQSDDRQVPGLERRSEFRDVALMREPVVGGPFQLQGLGALARIGFLHGALIQQGQPDHQRGDQQDSQWNARAARHA